MQKHNSKEEAMTDIYEKLRERLDMFPQGFPKTKSGVELKILKELFSPEEAEIMMSLEAIPGARRYHLEKDRSARIGNGRCPLSDVQERIDSPRYDRRTDLLFHGPMDGGHLGVPVE